MIKYISKWVDIMKKQCQYKIGTAFDNKISPIIERCELCIRLHLEDYQDLQCLQEQV